MLTGELHTCWWFCSVVFADICFTPYHKQLQVDLNLFVFNPTWTLGRPNAPPVSVIYCALRGVPMNSKLLEFLTYHLNLLLKNIFFPIAFNCFEKIDCKYRAPSENIKTQCTLCKEVRIGRQPPLLSTKTPLPTAHTGLQLAKCGHQPSPFTTARPCQIPWAMKTTAMPATLTMGGFMIFMI